VMVSDTEIVPLYVGPVVRVGRRLEACSSAMQDNQLRGPTRYPWALVLGLFMMRSHDEVT
jgi:hypothetical protein